MTGPTPATPATAGDTAHEALRPAFDALRAAWLASQPSIAQRRDDLARLRDALRAGTDAMIAAISADFGHRAAHETRIAEAMTTLSEIDHLRGHLRAWSRPRYASAGWRLWPARAQLRPRPLGVVGVMSPWNYPVNLALAPLATAIAAGNHVFLKPSEHTPRTSEWLRTLLAQVFPADRVAVATGGAALAGAFAALPFDHLVFTGSTETGRKVAAAAAPNLTPLTLELGGKSPAIVDRDVDVARVAARLATGKWFNAGQTCIAPDYVLVQRAQLEPLVDALRDEARARYAGDGAADLTCIVNDDQHARLNALAEDARARGATVLPLLDTGAGDASAARRLPPTLVLDAPDDARLMQEEIFGPLLPVRAYDTLDEAIAFVESRPRPLALYPFSGDRRTVDTILSRLVAGGATVNDTLLHFAASGLPFGGVGASGIGRYHGQAGFDAMSHLMPVLWQPKRSATDLLKPPYRGIADRMIRFLSR